MISLRADVLELQQLLDGDLFESLQVPLLAAGFDDELQLFGGVAASGMSARAERARKAPRGSAPPRYTNGSKMR